MVKFKNWMKFSVVILLVLGWASSTQAQKVSRQMVVLGGQSTRVSQGGFLDLSTGTVYSLKEATQNQGNIDVLYVHAKASGANLIAPSSTGLKGFSRYNKGVLEAWDTRNRTNMVLLGKGKKNRQVFRRAKTNDQLKKAYDDGAVAVKELPDYKVSKYGPALRLRSLEPGDYIAFRSRVSGRDIYAIAQVTDIKSGIQGSISLDIKTPGK